MERREPRKLPEPKSTAIPERDYAREAIDRYWAKLSVGEREALEDEAVRKTDRFLADQYRQGKESGGVLFNTVRQAIIDQHIRKQLE